MIPYNPEKTPAGVFPLFDGNNQDAGGFADG